MNKKYLKYNFYGKSNWKWIGLNVKEEQIYCKSLDVLYVHIAHTWERNNSEIFYGLYSSKLPQFQD
jgi:hypothetical protein